MRRWSGYAAENNLLLLILFSTQPLPFSSSSSCFSTRLPTLLPTSPHSQYIILSYTFTFSSSFSFLLFLLFLLLLFFRFLFSPSSFFSSGFSFFLLLLLYYTSPFSSFTNPGCSKLQLQLQPKMTALIRAARGLSGHPSLSGSSTRSLHTAFPSTLNSWPLW